MSPGLLGAPARHATASLLRCQSDARLVELVRAGSEPAFEALVARYEKPLLRYCTGLLPHDRAEDAVQTTFMNALRAIQDSHAEINLRPWLYRIAHNASISHLRDRCWSHTTIDENIDGVERPDQAFARRQGLRDVLTAVTALPQHQRDAMVLRELEGRTYEEIGERLGVSTGSVRQLLNRGRNTLRAGATAVTPPMLLLWPAADASAAVPFARLAARLFWSGGAKASAVKAGLAVMAVSAAAGGAGGGGVPNPGGDLGTGPAEASVPAGPARAERERRAAERARTMSRGDLQARRGRGDSPNGDVGRPGDHRDTGDSPHQDAEDGGPKDDGRSEAGLVPAPGSEDQSRGGHRGGDSDEPQDFREDAPDGTDETEEDRPEQEESEHPEGEPEQIEPSAELPDVDVHQDYGAKSDGEGAEGA